MTSSRTARSRASSCGIRASSATSRPTPRARCPPASITGAEGEKFTAGDLGERTVGAKGEILLGPPTVFDKANIDDFDF